MIAAVVPALAILAACNPPERDGGPVIKSAAGTADPLAAARSDAARPASGATQSAPLSAISGAARLAPSSAPPVLPSGTASVAPSGMSAPAPGAEASPRRVVIAGVDLTGVGYDKGSAIAPVVVVNFSDFGCPFCGSFARETEPVLVKEYVETGKVFIKYVPFVMGMFPNGAEAARAAECSGEQGRFWPMHDRLYDRQKEWKGSLAPYGPFQQYARAIGLDGAAFSRCYTGTQLHQRTARANGVAEKFGVRATPSFVVNGRGVEGALPLPQFRTLLDEALGSRP